MDLGAPRRVDRITLYNRSDCCAFRLRYFAVRVGDAYPTDASYPNGAVAGVGGVNSLCAYYNGIAPDGHIDVACSAPVFGRYLSIQILYPYDGVLTLCEVQVYGATTAA